MQKHCCALLFLILVSFPLAAQSVKGRVTTEGSPLPGVTVSIDELKLTTITDADGRYTLNLPSNRKGEARITASLQGFATRSATIDTSGNTTQDFALRPPFGQEITVGSRAVNAEQVKAGAVDIIPREEVETAPPTETNQINAEIAPAANPPRPAPSDHPEIAPL